MQIQDLGNLLWNLIEVPSSLCACVARKWVDSEIQAEI